MTERLTEFGEAIAERYRVLGEIGRGGMSTVFAAEDLKHDRQVAIKVLRDELAASVGADRFLREIGIAARLAHPHVLPLLDSGVAAGQLYYVMPLVQGESLRDRLLREAPLPMPAAVRILVDTADALRYAHEQGIVHRDIKPENIMLSGRHALVMDFGVARALGVGRSEGGTHRTTIGVALGTPAYMAPEQAAADPTVDHRADLYALGVVGYEILAGRPPFVGDTPQRVLAAQVTEAPPQLGDLRPDLPAPLVSAIMQLLAKRPGERIQSAAELIELLEPFAVSSGSLTPVDSVAVARSRRRRRIIGVVAGAVVLLAGVALAARRDREVLRPGITRQLTVAEGLELDPALSRDGRILAYAAGPNGRMKVYVRQLGEGTPIAVAPGLDVNQRSPSWSPDGARVAFAAGPSVWITPALGGAPRLAVEGSEDTPAGSPAWSPDGRRLAVTRGGRIEIHDLDATAEPRTLLDNVDAPHSLAWSADGRLLAFVSGNRDFALSETLLGNVAPAVIRVVPIDGGEPHTITEAEALSVSPAWLPDGRSLLYVSNRGGVRDVWYQRLARNGARSGDPERLTTGLGAHGVSVGADGRQITYSAFSLTSNVWSLALPERGTVSVRSAEPVTSGNQAVEDLDVLPGGRWLLFDSNRTGNHDIFLMPLRGGDAFQLTNNAADDFGPAWSPDGLEIAFYSMRAGSRDIFVMSNDGRRVTQVTSGPEQDTQPRWSPDGARLVFNRTEDPNRTGPWVATRRADSTWSDPAPLAEDGTAAIWSPDGDWIAYLDSRSQVHVIPSAGGPSRIVVRSSDLGGAGAPRRPLWLSEDTLLVRQALPGGQGAIWMVPLAGGSPRMVVKFDDPSRTVFRDDFSTDGERIYFPMSRLESDLWSMELERIRR